MKGRRKFSVRVFGNDGRRKKNEGDLVHSETTVEDRGGSGHSDADFICLTLCGAGLSLRPSAGAYQHIFAICGMLMLIVGPRQNGIIALILAFLISPSGLSMAVIWLLGK